MCGPSGSRLVVFILPQAVIMTVAMELSEEGAQEILKIVYYQTSLAYIPPVELYTPHKL